MLSATLSCSSKTSSSEPPKRSAQRCAPLSASISCAVIRTRPAAFRTEHIADAEFAADLLHLDYLALVGEGRIAGDDEEPPDARQRGDDLLDHAVGEIFLLRIAAHIGKRQYRDRRLGRKRQRRLGSPHSCAMRAFLPRLRGRAREGAFRSHPVDPHRPRNVLERLPPHILKDKGQPVANMVLNRIGDEHPAGIGQCFDARRDVDAVA